MKINYQKLTQSGNSSEEFNIDEKHIHLYSSEGDDSTDIKTSEEFRGNANKIKVRHAQPYCFKKSFIVWLLFIRNQKQRTISP